MSTQISIFPKLSWWAVVPHCSLFLGNVCLCEQTLKKEKKIINSWAIQIGKDINSTISHFLRPLINVSGKPVEMFIIKGVKQLSP